MQDGHLLSSKLLPTPGPAEKGSTRGFQRGKVGSTRCLCGTVASSVLTVSSIWNSAEGRSNERSGRICPLGRKMSRSSQGVVQTDPTLDNPLGAHLMDLGPARGSCLCATSKSRCSTAGALPARGAKTRKIALAAWWRTSFDLVLVQELGRVLITSCHWRRRGMGDRGEGRNTCNVRQI